MKLTAYTQAIKQLKAAILSSRYRAAVLANKELLTLYFNVGKLITEKSQQGKWGDKILIQLSADLQHELPGLKGFSVTNIKRMRLFYQQWNSYFLVGQSATNPIGPTPSDQLKKTKKIANKFTISPTLSDQLAQQFFLVSFSHHCEILVKTISLEERQFYIAGIATEYWSLDTLKHHINNKLFKKKGKLPNNFNTTIANTDLRAKALQAFKDEYLLDFINIEDPDEEDEKVIESEIVRNIKKFIHSIGADFAFIGNQYRVIVDEEEYFIDLLFFNRKLQCLVAFELKKGKFKPAYVGQLNFYLSALDDMIKQPHEQPSIGIILCKEKSNKTVEFCFRDMTKPMGVATYKTSKQLPKQYKNVLPDVETLKKLMD